MADRDEEERIGSRFAGTVYGIHEGDEVVVEHVYSLDPVECECGDHRSVDMGEVALFVHDGLAGTDADVHLSHEAALRLIFTLQRAVNWQADSVSDTPDPEREAARWNRGTDEVQ